MNNSSIYTTQMHNFATNPYPPIPPKAPNALRVVSLNVNGWRAAVKKGLLDYLHASDFDVVCLQETRVLPAQLTPNLLPRPIKNGGFIFELFAAQKAGYAGTAILSRLPLQNVVRGLGFALADNEGRFIAADVVFGGKNLTIASLYLPSGSSGDSAQARKDAFLLDYRACLARWSDTQKSIIICGDYNIVHKPCDIKNWSGNKNSSGCLPHERAFLDDCFGTLGFQDSFRAVRFDKHVYSWWSNRGQARANNTGWRIDYQMASTDVCAIGAWVYRECFFSDHAPVIVDYLV